jgi:transcriptional regulator with XRE-family HTH domain
MDYDSLESKIKILGKNLQFLRQGQGLTQEEVAGSLGLTRQTVAAIEKGLAKPNIKTVFQIAGFFDTPIESMFMELERKYCVFTCDVVNSRSVLHRQKLESKINSLLKQINRQYENLLLTKFNITLGDEFQGVFRRFHRFLDIFLSIKEGILPYDINIGIGVGSVGTRIYRAHSHKMDGPAFHYARDMVEKAKPFNGHFYIRTGNEYDDILNLLVEEVNFIFSGLTPKQIKLLKLYAERNNQIQVSEILGVSQAYVSRILKTLNYERIKRIFDEIEILINRSLKG